MQQTALSSSMMRRVPLSLQKSSRIPSKRQSCTAQQFPQSHRQTRKRKLPPTTQYSVISYEANWEPCRHHRHFSSDHFLHAMSRQPCSQKNSPMTQKYGMHFHRSHKTKKFTL